MTGRSKIQIQNPGPATAVNYCEWRASFSAKHPLKSITDSTAAELYYTGKLRKAQIYANMLWHSSVTPGQEPIGITSILAKTEAKSKFTSWCEGLISWSLWSCFHNYLRCVFNTLHKLAQDKKTRIGWCVSDISEEVHAHVQWLLS